MLKRARTSSSKGHLHVVPACCRGRSYSWVAVGHCSGRRIFAFTFSQPDELGVACASAKPVRSEPTGLTILRLPYPGIEEVRAAQGDAPKNKRVGSLTRNPQSISSGPATGRMESLMHDRANDSTS